MSDYQNYIDNLVKQPLETKLKALVAEIRNLWEDNRAAIKVFKGVEKEIEEWLKNPGSSVEDLSAFASKLKERLPLLNQLKHNLDELHQYRTISDALKQTIGNLGDYCMSNLSLDEILKASEGTENLKQQAEAQKSAFEQLQTVYMVNEKLIGFFEGVDQQFKNLMKYQNINAETVSAFAGVFNQNAELLAGLKFQIGRMNNDVLENSGELQQLTAYCRREMTLQETGHCHGELGRHEAERKRQKELRKQVELKKKKAKRQKDTPVSAPMPGMIIRYEKYVGDSVSIGDIVVLLEAMKMENALAAPTDGTIKTINFSDGDSVAKNDVLAIIE